MCVGTLREDAGTVDAPIGRHPVERKKMAVDRKNGRPAVTHWQVLARYPGHTHIRCRLETGRTHQIRVHMASIGHPLLGDTVYGAKKPVPGLAGQCLHARRLSFIHPPHRGAGDGGVPPAGLFHAGAGAAGPADIAPAAA